MKRAILVTTGTVVGITSVLAYKPNTGALALVPGTEALTTSASVSTQRAQTATTADPAGAESAAAVADDSTPTPSATTKASAAAKATATAKASAAATTKATAAAKATASSTPRANASATPSSSATSTGNTTGLSAADGTHTGSSEIVESHGRTYGSLVATVTVNNGKLTAVSFEQTPSGRNEQFISAVNTYLVPEILRTQNVSVGIVTGATGTSMALISSLKSALGLA